MALWEVIKSVKCKTGWNSSGDNFIEDFHIYLLSLVLLALHLLWSSFRSCSSFSFHIYSFQFRSSYVCVYLNTFLTVEMVSFCSVVTFIVHMARDLHKGHLLLGTQNTPGFIEQGVQLW